MVSTRLAGDHNITVELLMLSRARVLSSSVTSIMGSSATPIMGSSSSARVELCQLKVPIVVARLLNSLSPPCSS